MTFEALVKYFVLFLNDGEYYNFNILDELISKATLFESVITKSHYKFFTSSVFMAYDAQDTSKVVFKFIDLEHAWNTDKEVVEYSDGVALGFKSIITLLNTVKEKYGTKRIPVSELKEN